MNRFEQGVSSGIVELFFQSKRFGVFKLKNEWDPNLAYSGLYYGLYSQKGNYQCPIPQIVHPVGNRDVFERNSLISIEN